jgi:type IV pilus assembly protein PilB
MAFIDSLVEKGIIKKSEVESITKEIHDNGSTINESLLSRGIESSIIMKLKSEYFNIPIKNIDNIDSSFEILKYVPEESATYYKFVPIGVSDGVLEIGIVNPDNIGARDAIQFIVSKLNIPFKLYLISHEDFKSIVVQYKGLSGEVNKALTELESEFAPSKTNKKNDIEDIGVPVDGDKTKTRIVEDAPVTKIVAVILKHAIEGNASDIHIEDMGDNVRVRFRIDGSMHTSLILPSNVHDAVVARVKVLSNLKLDEKRKPQDGRFSAKIEGRKVDFRVSTLPSYYGEKVVMRVLDGEKGVKSLSDLGLSDENIKTIKEALKRPYGLILLTGPTGSGKTTTLYSMLNEIDRDASNVVSLEDPIEYNIYGISQSQIRPEIGYTFANGLRSILRQDPDIIMIGEIRDKETAQLAVQAALTGHLVFSTLHTNNTAGVIPRLVDMGVDPFLIAPTLVLAIAQRLVSSICEGGGEEVSIDESTKMMIEDMVKDLPKEKQKRFLLQQKVHEPKSTSVCPTGVKGRVAVYEILKVDKDIEHTILNSPFEEEVYKVSRSKGMITMKEDALQKTFNGIVPFEEVNRL